MKKKMILEKCQILGNTIDGLMHQDTPLYGESLRRPGQIRMFADDVIDEEKFFKRVLEPKFKGLESDEYDEMLNRFALGFTAGQIVELPDKAVNRDIVSLVKVMKEKKLLPIFPREK
jgi:hypothetical protein